MLYFCNVKIVPLLIVSVPVYPSSRILISTTLVEPYIMVLPDPDPVVVPATVLAKYVYVPLSRYIGFAASAILSTVPLNIKPVIHIAKTSKTIATYIFLLLKSLFLNTFPPGK